MPAANLRQVGSHRIRIEVGGRLLCFARNLRGAQLDQLLVTIDGVPRRDRHPRDHAVVCRCHDVFHLHRFEHH